MRQFLWVAKWVFLSRCLEAFPTIFILLEIKSGTPTVSSFQRVLQCTRSACMRSVFISWYFYCFFACNKSCLDLLAFGCDAWSRFLGCGCEHYPGFWVEEDKC
jgi:hypothetical protein